MKLSWSLMENNITREDLDILIEFLRGMPRLTQSSNVQAFETEWSKWLGVRYSVYVNSGASANLITMAARLSDKTRAVFLTHVQGFNGLTDGLLSTLQKRNIPLIEDVCESHRATFKEKKLGSFGLISNFSFYFTHHMSTIEGGMVCTNDQNIYETVRMLRSHGIVREASSDAVKKKYAQENPELSPDFIFAFPAYNVRSTEIGAVIGRNQLKRLDENNAKRKRNFEIFLKNLDSNKYRTGFDPEGGCNYAFNLIINKPDPALRDRVEKTLRDAGVEFRRGSSGDGNQLRQPYLKTIIPDKEWENYPEVEHVHFYGYYIGNYPGLEEQKILSLCDLLNKA